MTYQTITVDVTDKIATITLNRPERMNACSLDMAGEINDALSADIGDARCLIITGAGRGFCSGADLSARGEISKCSVARFGSDGAKVEAVLCRVAGYIPPKSPGRKPGASS